MTDINYLTEGPIPQTLISMLLEGLSRKKDIGGHTIFLGQVRDDLIDGKKVKAIEYSAYIEMVSSIAEKIKKEIFSEFSDVKSIDIVHSIGIVHAGQISLLVLVSAGHRAQAMLACEKTVDFIKADLPVWKKEIFEDDSHNWK